MSDQDEPTTVSPFTKSEKTLIPDEARDPDGARNVSPFMVINRGDDTVDRENRVVFADFSPKVLPANVEEEPLEVTPKDESAPGYAASSGSKQTTVQKQSETTVPTPASEADGTLSQSESSSPTSSSDPKNGQSEQPA